MFLCRRTEAMTHTQTQMYMCRVWRCDYLIMPPVRRRVKITGRNDNTHRVSAPQTLYALLWAYYVRAGGVRVIQ